MSSINNTSSTHIVINSKNRLQPSIETTSSFTYSINRPVNRITEMVIESIQIPYSFYAINSTNNVLIVADTPYTIPPGNYNTVTLAAELVNKLGLNPGDVVFNTTTYKLTITFGGSVTVESITSDPSSTLSPLLGFTSAVTNDVVTAPSAFNISGPNYLLLVSNFLTKPIHNKIIFANDSYQNVLYVIPLTVGPGDIISSVPDISPLYLSYKFSIATTDKIDFLLTDPNNNIVNLNGLDMSLTILCKIE